MLDKFLSYINEQKLLSMSDKTLLAVSGGVDSMVMVDLFRRANLPFAIAHINHQLRGSESEGDQVFLEEYCKQHSISLHVYKIPPSLLSTGNMHAKTRAIRYQFFEETLQKMGYTHVATAHHKDDATETFLINMMRGAGMDGLSGIAVKNGNIIRPLLFATRAMIEEYVATNIISYREDNSNASDKYLRNKVRHHLIPLIHEIDSRSLQGLPNSIDNIANTNQLLHSLVQSIQNEYLTVADECITVDLIKVLAFDQPSALLYQLIYKMGFNIDNCQQILQHIGSSGSQFLTNSHHALRDRNRLLIWKNEASPPPFDDIELSIPAKIHAIGKEISFEYVEDVKNIQFMDGIQYICLDDITAPITIRKWMNGDSFAPLGMLGKHQKVQDYLTNIKVSRKQKDEVLVMTSADKILAILGYRISEFVKTSPTSARVVKITTS